MASFEFLNVLASALSHFGFAAAAAVEHCAGFAHQRVHVAGCIGRASEDETSSFFVA